jgi:hypothetical protein
MNFTILLLSFVLFGLAILGMAVGVLVKGRNLAGSCGGKIIIDEDLEDCVCVVKEADMCASDEENDLVRLAQIGNPSRKDFHIHPGRASDPPLDV